MNSRGLRFCILGADLLWVVGALFLASQLRYGFALTLSALQDWLVAFGPALGAALVLWTIVSLFMKWDGFRGGWQFRAVFSDALVGVSLLLVLLLAAGYLARAYRSRLVLFYFGLLLCGSFVAIRCVTYWILRARYSAEAVRRVAILGGGRIAKELATKITRHPEMRWQVVGFLCPDEQTYHPVGDGSRASQTVRTVEILDLLAEKHVSELIVVLPHPGREILNLVARCRAAGIHVSMMPQFYELYISRPRLAEIDGLPLISLEEHIPPAISQAIKRFMDLAGTLLLLVLSFPLLLVFAGILHLRKGRAFQRDLRCGKNGKTFWMFRLNINRESTTLAAHEKILLKLSVTELPQLWNVLRGEMSLVGPRPEPPDRVKHYSEWQRQRLALKPGITGLAQVQGLRDQHSSEEKSRFDLQYILRWSLLLDLSLILQTAWTLGARLLETVKGEPVPAEAGPPLQETASVVESAYANSSQPSSD